MTLTTAQTLVVVAILTGAAAALLLTIAALIRRDGPARRGRHAAPPTPPPPATEPDPGPRTLAAGWRQQVALPPDPVLVRPYVTRHYRLMEATR